MLAHQLPFKSNNQLWWVVSAILLDFWWVRMCIIPMGPMRMRAICQQLAKGELVFQPGSQVLFQHYSLLRIFRRVNWPPGNMGAHLFTSCPPWTLVLVFWGSMPAVRTTRSTSQDMGGTDTGNRGTVETSSSAVQALKEVDSRSISALGRGRDENFTLGYSSKRPARLKCGIQQTTDRLKTTVTTVGEFCRGVLSYIPEDFVEYLHCWFPVQAKTPDLGRGGRRSCARGRCCHGWSNWWMTKWKWFEFRRKKWGCTLWLCQNSYWKWPFIVDFPIKNGDFP